jgi:hypothetical protein
MIKDDLEKLNFKDLENLKYLVLEVIHKRRITEDPNFKSDKENYAKFLEDGIERLIEDGITVDTIGDLYVSCNLYGNLVGPDSIELRKDLEVYIERHTKN